MDRERWSARQQFLWHVLRCLRTESKQTQAELALALQRSQTYVSKYEMGERRLDFFEIDDICHACGLSMAELVERIELELKKKVTIQRPLLA